MDEPLTPEMLAVLYWVVAFLAINVLLLLMATCVARVVRNRHAAQRERFREQWQPVLYDHMAGDGGMLPVLPAGQRLEFLMLWIHTAGYVRDEDAVRLIKLAHRLELPDYVLQLLRSRRRWKRLVAMRAAGALRLEAAVGILAQEAAGGRMRMALTAVGALLKISPAAGALALHQLLGHIRWAPAAVADIARTAGADTLKVLIGVLHSAPAGGARNVIRVIEALEDPTALPALRKRFDSGGDQVEKACLLRALGKLGDDSDRLRALTSLGDSHRLVRMQAAFALGRLGLPEDIWALLPLLSDADWWVRYRSAQSLLSLVRGEPRTLAVLRAKIRDGYGREMLDRVMAERSAG